VIHSDGSQEIITSAFFRTGDIKSWGRGIEKVRNACIEYGTDFPTFQFMPDGLLVMFKGRIPAEDSTQKISENAGENAGEYYPRNYPRTRNRPRKNHQSHEIGTFHYPAGVGRKNWAI